MLRRASFLLVLISGLTSVAAMASDLSDLGPAIGSKIPHDLTAPDQEGVEQSFNTLTGEKGAVLVFFRSAKWCPFCQKQLIQMQAAQADIKARGYKLIAISYDTVPQLAQFAGKRKIGYTLLSDQGSRIIDAFGIRNDTYASDHYAYGVPYPLILVVDSAGLVRAKLWEESYRDRPETVVILEAIDGL